jgi:hypothetical protein
MVCSVHEYSVYEYSVYGVQCVRCAVCTVCSVYGVQCVRCAVCTGDPLQRGRRVGLANDLGVLAEVKSGVEHVPTLVLATLAHVVVQLAEVADTWWMGSKCTK